MNCKKTLAAMAILTVTVAWCAAGAAYAGNLVLNGNFEDTTNVAPPDFSDGSSGYAGSGGLGLLDYNTVATGWSSPDMNVANATGYNFIMSLPTADTLSEGVYGYNGKIGLYGPDNGRDNGLTASPVGGNFLAADGDTRYNGPVEQTINNLAPGTYQLSFYWALAQQWTGAVTGEGQWEVSLGNQTQSTTMVSLPSVGGFVPWMYETMTFTVTTAGSEVLSFLANEGGPYGWPPFLLLDGVSLDAVPEPGSFVLLGIGVIGITAAGYLRRGAARRRVEVRDGSIANPIGDC